MPLATIAELVSSRPALAGRTDLSLLLAGADKAIRAWVKRRHLERGPVDLPIDGPGTRILLLPEFPASDITAVEIDGLAVTDWRLVAERRLYRKAGWPRGIENVRAAYTAGYSPIPEDLRIAAILTAANLARFFPVEEATAGAMSGSAPSGPLRKLQIDGYVEEFAEGPGREEARILALDLAAAIPSVAKALLADYERPRA